MRGIAGKGQVEEGLKFVFPAITRTGGIVQGPSNCMMVMIPSGERVQPMFDVFLQLC